MVAFFLSGVVVVIGSRACVSGNGFLGQVVGRVLMLGALLCVAHGLKEMSGIRAPAQCVMAWTSGVLISFAAWIVLGIPYSGHSRLAWPAYVVAVVLFACGAVLLVIAV